MKLSDGFDARRLRPGGRKSWRLRIGAAIGALLAIFGALLTLLGGASLFGRAEALGSLGVGRDGAIVLLVLGFILFCTGIGLWRGCRRRMRQPGGLSISRRLLKKRD